jgi:signal transduction histidine kinase/ABC-type multidrug transport system ATPase subunit
VAPRLLELSGVGVNLGRRPVLHGVDLTVSRREVVALSGEPGAGKTTLMRCIAGDITANTGEIWLDGELIVPTLAAPRRTSRRDGVGVVWQEPELCDNLDVDANLLLGNETFLQMLSDSRRHDDATAMLAELGIELGDTTRMAGALPRGQRQLLAVAVALVRESRLLILDEPTVALGLKETAELEAVIRRLARRGRGVLIATRDIDQMFRLADRIVMLRHGHVVAELDPRVTHPDDVAALLAGQPVESSARRQLERLHGLSDRLATADPASSPMLILSAVGAALGVEQLCIHVVAGEQLICEAALGFTPEHASAFAALPRRGGSAVARAAAGSATVVVEDVRDGNAWAPLAGRLAEAAPACSWSLPVAGPDGVNGVLTVFRDVRGVPGRDELELLRLYAGYAATAMERERAAVAQQEAVALRRSRELQREFLSRLSHELRTPLTAVRGYASSLAQSDVTWDPDSERAFLSRIVAESTRLGRLVDDLLDFSAIESGVMRLQLDWCDLGLVLEAAVGCLPAERLADVSVEEPAETPVVWADHDRLEQVFVNLLTNAIRHNPADTKVHIQVRTPSAHSVEIVVSDDGPGFPADLAATPFDLPRRGRSRGGGAGLGLSIARGIVEAHRGRIELVTASGTGTAFRITLPVEGELPHIAEQEAGEAVEHARH